MQNEIDTFILYSYMGYSFICCAIESSTVGNGASHVIRPDIRAYQI